MNVPVCVRLSDTQKTVFTSAAERLPRCGNPCDNSHDGASACSVFFKTAKGGVKGPVSTSVEKAFSQIGLARRINSAEETVGVRTGAEVAVGIGAVVDVGRGVCVDSIVCVGVTAGVG